MSEHSGLPAPVCGSDVDKPGYWATLAKTNSWLRDGQQATKPWLLYDTLRTRQLCREPGVRTPISGIEFYYDINSRSAIIESLLAQSVGHVMPPGEACEECKKAKGIFTSCVVVQGLVNEMPECANCHWHSWPVGKACSFVQTPASVSGQTSPFSTGVFIATGEELMGLDTALRGEIILRNDAHNRGDLDDFDLHHQKIQDIIKQKHKLLDRK